jgi:hypothetical protein
MAPRSRSSWEKKRRCQKPPVASVEPGHGLDVTVVLAKRGQLVATALFPQITPFPAAQIAPAGFGGSVKVQEAQRAADVVLLEGLADEVHVGVIQVSLGPLPLFFGASNSIAQRYGQ